MFTGLLPSSPSGSDSDDEDECVVQKKVDESCNSKETTSKGEHRQKFQERLAVLSDERKILASKHEAKRISALRKQAIRAVQKALTEEDLEAIEELPKNLSRPRKRAKDVLGNKEGPSEPAVPEGSSGSYKEKWTKLKAYLNPNPQLKGTDPGRHAEQSGLEKELDKAIEEADLERAVEISNELAGREFAVKIAKAFDCLEYVQEKEVEEARQKRKKPRLKWTFEAKQNWEMKSNM